MPTTDPKANPTSKEAQQPKTSTAKKTTATATNKTTTAKTATAKARVVSKGVHKGVSDELMHEIKAELENMLSFALRNGKTINTELNPLIQSDNLDDLIHAHNMLCKNIAPATPKSIEYIKALSHKEGNSTLFNRLPIIRNLVFLAIFFLVIFVGSSLSDQVNTTSLSKGVLSNSGLSLLLNLLFLFGISGLGVVFYLLRNISESVKKATLTPEHTIYYIALIVLGLISGLILSEIVASYDEGKELSIFNNAVLALIGGFSSDAIFSILQEIINKIKSVFSANQPN